MENQYSVDHSRVDLGTTEMVVSLDAWRNAREETITSLVNQRVTVQGEDVIERWRSLFRSSDETIRSSAYGALSEAVASGSMPPVIAELILVEKYA